MVKLTDTHAHIHMPPLNDSLQDVVERAAQAGVERIITVGINAEDSEIALQTACSFENVYAAAGVHPEDSANYNDFDYQRLLQTATHKRVIAVGEIGLDFYRDYAPKDVQERVFRRMLELSLQVKKPVIIHNRNADDDCLRVLNEVVGNGKGYGGVFHCFSGSIKVIDWAIDNGFYISFAGQLTYKSADDLRFALKHVPLNRLLVETDCPYLAPVPKRGKTNEPAYAVHTAAFMAKELQIELNELAAVLEVNTSTLFSGQL